MFTASAVMILAIGALPACTQTEYGHYSPGAGKNVSEDVDVGIVGYGALQLSITTGSDFTGDPTKYRYAGIGPEVQWLAVSRSTWAMMIQLRVYFEFAALNAPTGTAGVLSFSFHLPKGD